MNSKDDDDDDDDVIFVLPGDIVSHHLVQPQQPGDKILLGTGLARRSNNNNNNNSSKEDDVYATLSGILHYQCRSLGGSNGKKSSSTSSLVSKKKKKHVYWIQSSNSGRPLVQVHDRVVGIVHERIGPDGMGGEYYRLHLGDETRMTAVLSNLSFEGATKRNKPHLEIRQVLYARVKEYLAGLEPVLSCQLGPHDTSIPTKDWMTNEGIYGILQGGTVFTVSHGLARVLLSQKASGLWESVTRHELTSTFEIAIGVNGLVWIHATPSPQATIILQNAILNSQLLTPEQTVAMVQQLVYTMQKQIQREQDRQSIIKH